MRNGETQFSLRSVTALICVLGSAARAPPFEIVWNSPWPSACAANTSADALSRWGVTTNAANAFNGAAVTTLYNSPGRMTLGLWPCYRANGSAINGGLPQLADLGAHLAQVKVDAAAALKREAVAYACLPQHKKEGKKD